MKVRFTPFTRFFVTAILAIVFAGVNYASVTGGGSKTKLLPASYFAQRTVMEGVSNAKVYSIDKGANVSFTNPYGTNTMSVWAGTFNGVVDEQTAKFFCIDILHPLAFYKNDQPHTYTDSGPTAEQITYVLNHYYPYVSYPYTGAASSEEREAAAVQMAIWHYSDGVDVNTMPDGAIKTRALAIIMDADANYDGYYPLETLLIVPSNQSIPVGELGTFTIATFDDNGDPVSGVDINISTTDGTLSSMTVTTDATGTAGPVTIAQGAALEATITATANVQIPQGTRYIHAISPDEYQKLVLATPAGATRLVTAEVNWYTPNEECDLNGYTTYTQGGWGSPSKSTPGKIRDTYFDDVFPGGMTIGGTYTITLTTAEAVMNFLPQGGTAEALTQNYTNPTNNITVLAGQVAAMKLNIYYSAAGYIGTNTTPLGDLVIAGGPFAGMTATDFLAFAEEVLGGGSLNGFSYSEVNDAATAINENFDNGTVDNGYLTCETERLPIHPILECVTNNHDGTYTAHFGYLNENSFPVTIAVGPNNKFSPSPEDRGQTTVFNPGRTPYYPDADFQVVFDGNELVWTLDGNTATASANSQPCSEHIYFDKQWFDESETLMANPPADLPEDYKIVVTSSIGTAEGKYDNGTLTWTYDNTMPPALDNNGLWVPVNEEYTVEEFNMPSGYTAWAGVGTFVAEIPGGYATNPYDGLDKNGYHLIKNKKVECQNSIGDYIWHDANVDGKQDDDEEGIAGVVVNLLSGSNTIATTTTDENGFYEFAGLANGTYTVKVADSNFEEGGNLYNWYATTKDAAADNLDSDGHITNHTASVTVNCQDNPDVDFGFFLVCLDFTKTGPDTAQPGDVITYTFRVENCGDVVLAGGVSVYDEMLKPTQDHKIWHKTVQPGEVYTFTKTYTVQESDCGGELINNAYAVGCPYLAGRTIPNITVYDSWGVEIDCSSPCVEDWNGNLGGDEQLCNYETTELTVNGSVELIPNPSQAKLVTGWQLIYPVGPEYDNTPHTTEEWIEGNTNFTITGQWPGIKPDDTEVRVRFFMTVYDCDENEIGSELTKDIYWTPEVCPPPPYGNVDLEIEKSSSTLYPSDGDQVTFTIKVTNNGPDEANGVKAADILPDGLIYESDNPSQGDFDEITGIWTVGTLASGAFATLSITATVDVEEMNNAAFDLGVAADYNLFVINDLTQPSSDTQGKVAVGRDAHLANYSIGDQLPTTDEDVLIVGRDLTYESGHVYGNVVYGNTTNLPIPSTSIAGTLRKDYVINFAAAKTYLENLSTQLGAYSVNGTAVYQWSGYTLTGNDPFLNVFHLDGTDFSAATWMDITVPSGSVVLVNIDGTDVDWTGGLEVHGTTIENVLYNFYHAQTLSIQGIDVRGSILAPFADVDFPFGVQNGQMMCKSLTGTGQFNYVMFIGNIPVQTDITNIASITSVLEDDSDLTNNTSSVTVHVNQPEPDNSSAGDDGSTWQEVGSFVSTEIVYSLANDKDGNMLAGTWGGKIYRSLNGEDWFRINESMYAGLIWTLAVNVEGYIFAGTEQGIYRSTDNGVTWTLIGLVGSDVRSIAIDSNGDLYAGVWGGGVFKSVDNGATWTEKNDGLTNLAVNSLVINSRSEIYAAAFGSGVFKSTDFGATWTQLTVGYDYVWTLGVTSQDVLYAGTYGDGLYRSYNDGADWAKVYDGMNAYFIYAITVDAADHVYVSSWTAGVYVSNDEVSSSWQSVGLGGAGVSSLMINPASDELYAGTSDGAIYKRVTSNITDVDDTPVEVPTKFELNQNYPNPFNPTTVIQFSIPESGIYTLKVYNILGQEVATLLNGQINVGTHKITFDATQLSSGIYLYQLTGNNVNFTRKMILMK